MHIQNYITSLQETLIDLYLEFQEGTSISTLAFENGVTNTEMYNLVQMGKRLCQ